VHKLALKVKETWDIGPLPLADFSQHTRPECLASRYLLQESRCIDDKVCFILFNLTALFKLNLPFPRRLIPDCLLDGGAELDILGQVILLCRTLDIIIDLLLANVKFAPVRIALKWEDVSI
jgi:hypothetical protein